MKEEKRRK